MAELRVLGAVDLNGADADAAEIVLRQPKRLGLLTYLAIESRTHFARRDSLLALFWPELDEERGRHALRQALHMLRRALGNDAVERRGDDDVSVKLAALRCDAAAFEELLERGDAEVALALYGGDLLPGVFVSEAPAFERWLDETRQRLRERAVAAAQALERDANAAGDTAAATRWVRRALGFAPHDEPALRRLLDYLVRQGDRAGALSVYDAFAQRLAADLELEPSPETAGLARRLRTPTGANAAASPSTPVSPAAAVPAMAEAPVHSTAAPWHRRAAPFLALAVAAVVVVGVWSLTASRGRPPAPSATTLKATIARRFYDEAMSAWSRGDMPAAERLAQSAFAQDSTLALALFVYSHFIGSRGQFEEGLRLQKQAVAMAAAQPDHDRLLILTWFAQNFSDPRFAAYAETLAIRYPDDLQALSFVANARRLSGEYLGAIAPLRRIIERDRGSLRRESRSRCFACAAFLDLVDTYDTLDSLDRAEAVVREWIREAPKDPDAWGRLGYELSIRGRYAEALAAQQRREDLTGNGSDLGPRGEILLRAGDFDTYEHILLERLNLSAQVESNDTRWKYWLLLRHQGRMREAMAQIGLMTGDAADEALIGIKLFMLGQSLLETGQFARSARLWDSLANHVPAREPPAQAARFRAWYGARRAEALGALRDTAALQRLADTIRADGQRSGRAIDGRLFHHVLGVLSDVRGDPGAACDHFRQSMTAAFALYPRTNVAIGRACIAARRSQDALKPLYGALHGPIGQAGTYGTMTEVHELLGALHDALGQPDSARYWYGRAADAWKRADPEWMARPERRAGVLRIASSARPAGRARQD